MAKEMMKACVQHGMQVCDQVKVKSPPDISDMRTSVAELREWAKGATEKEGDETGEKEEKKASSMLGGMMQAVADKVTDAAGSVIGGGLNLAADQIEKAIDG